MATSKIFKVGLIIGSQRVVRVGPQVTDFVLDSIKAAGSQTSLDTTTFDVIDLAAQNLPMFDEPGIPYQTKSPEDHVHEHTRIWARRIDTCDAFIFVAAQRNWGIPAELKNAIDYLFHEWKSKPAMIVTYGGHGGPQCAAQLKTVLGAIGMQVGEKMVNMSFPSPEFRVNAFKGQGLGLDASNDTGPWAEHRNEIIAVWDEMADNMRLV